jgi:phage recombination protein Bet
MPEPSKGQPVSNHPSNTTTDPTTTAAEVTETAAAAATGQALMPRPRFDPDTQTIQIPTPLADGFLRFTPGQRVLDQKQMVILSPLGIKANWDPAQVIMFLTECHHRGLDPYAGEAYLMQYAGGKYVRHIGIAGFRRLAEETGEYDGRDQALFCSPDGQWTEVWPHRDQVPYAAKITVYRRGRRPATVVALYDEYCPLEQDKVWDEKKKQKVPTGIGKVPTQMWRTPAAGGKPTVMLAKCAEAAALRALFPRRFAGFYEPAEFERVAAETPTYEADETAQRRREAYAAAHGAATVDGAEVGFEIVAAADTSPDGDESTGPLRTEVEMRALLLGELDAQARLIGQGREWMTRRWSESRGGQEFTTATLGEMTTHVHRFRRYVVDRLRAAGQHRLAETYHVAPLVGTLQELFGTDQPWETTDPAEATAVGAPA